MAMHPSCLTPLPFQSLFSLMSSQLPVFSVYDAAGPIAHQLSGLYRSGAQRSQPLTSSAVSTAQEHSGLYRSRVQRSLPLRSTTVSTAPTVIAMVATTASDLQPSPVPAAIARDHCHGPRTCPPPGPPPYQQRVINDDTGNREMLVQQQQHQQQHPFCSPLAQAAPVMLCCMPLI